MQIHRVLFTGGRSPATLALLRLFAKAGHHCYVAESLHPNVAGRSRYCIHNFRVPPPRQHSADYIAALHKIIHEEQIDFLIPTCEETYYISRYQRQLQDSGCQIFVANIDLLTNLHSKYQFNQLLQAMKIPAPLSEKIESQAQLKGRLPEWEQHVLKPEFSRFASEVFINETSEKLYASVDASSDKPWVLQEFLDGPQFCSYSVALNGQLQAHAVYPTRYSAGPGATIYFESVQIPEIQAIVETIVSSLDYTGQISFDFIFCRDTYYPIECNPRTTTGTFLFGPEDDLPRHFFQSDAAVLQPSTAQAVVLTLPMLLYALPTAGKKLGETLKDMFQAQDPLLVLDDFSPFIAQFGMLWQTFKIARKSQVSILEASTLDIEWNGFWT